MVLYELEAEIMEVVWALTEEWCAVSEVHEELLARRELAYTTVMTTVTRLYDKGLLERRRDGRRYLYRPTLSRDELEDEVSRQLLQAVPAGARAAAFLVQRVSQADQAELDELEAMIRARRHELEGS